MLWKICVGIQSLHRWTNVYTKLFVQGRNNNNKNPQNLKWKFYYLKDTGGGGICYFWHVALQLEIHGVDQASFKHTEILLFVPPEWQAYIWQGGSFVSAFIHA